MLLLSTQHPDIVISKGSKRAINLMTPTVHGFNAGSASPVRVDLRSWGPVGNWSVDVDGHGLFRDKALHILNSFILREPGTYQVSVNVIIDVLERVCATW